jgi:hypothetical protein
VLQHKAHHNIPLDRDNIMGDCYGIVTGMFIFGYFSKSIKKSRPADCRAVCSNNESLLFFRGKSVRAVNYTGGLVGRLAKLDYDFIAP